jgi:hypothetical protein
MDLNLSGDHAMSVEDTIAKQKQKQASASKNNIDTKTLELSYLLSICFDHFIRNYKGFANKL